MFICFAGVICDTTAYGTFAFSDLHLHPGNLIFIRANEPNLVPLPGKLIHVF
jgi:hypothetical protein